MKPPKQLGKIMFPRTLPHRSLKTFQRKVKLLLPEKPNPQQNIGKDMPMAVDEVLEVSAANTGLF